MPLVLSRGTVITADAADRVLPDADIRIEGCGIAAIGPGGTLQKPGDSIIDCSEAIVMPGLVNTHTHAATALFRGLADDRPAAFWSKGYRVPGEERFTLEDYKISLEAASAEFLLNGITCIADRLGRMQALAPVIEASGLRAICGDTLMDNTAPADWRGTEALIERYGTSAESRVSAGIAPHATDTCSDALLKECAARAGKTAARVFIHCAQSADEIAALKARRYSGAVDCLSRNGLAGPHVTAAHCIYLSQDEIAGWAKHQTAIAHCPSSNLKIEARTMALSRLIGRAAIGLGTDWTVTSNSADMFFEARLAALTGKMIAGDPETLTTREMLRMMTIEGARALGLERVTGSLELGKRADILVLDRTAPEIAPLHDAVSNAVHSASPRSVRDVIVDGEVLVRNSELTRADRREIARRHNRLGR